MFCLFTGLVLLAGCNGGAPAIPPPKHPNIIVILADDLGYGDLGIYNDESKIPTPTLDELARSGMRFTDAHAPSSVCTPSRYGLLTGRYAWRGRLKKGVLHGYDPSLIEPGRPTLASMLRERGYKTAAIGKWHLGLGDDPVTDFGKPFSSGPLTAGFDYFFGIPASLDIAPFVYIENDRVVTEPSEHIAEGVHRRDGGAGYWQAGAIAPGFDHTEVMPTLIDKSIDYIERQAADGNEQPFFLYLPLTAPHKPWLPTEEFIGKSGAGYYGDFVVQVDASVARVMAALERAELDEDTLIVFTSDNGSRWEPFEIEEFGHLANGPLRGQKTEIWEGGHRVPFVAAWTGKIPQDSQSEALVSLTDLFATIAALVDADPAADMAEDSISFLDALFGRKATAGRQSLVTHSSQGMFAMRKGGWKLIERSGSGGYGWTLVEDSPGQIYDLDADLGEQRNLIMERPDIEAKLKALLDSERD